MNTILFFLVIFLYEIYYCWVISGGIRAVFLGLKVAVLIVASVNAIFMIKKLFPLVGNLDRFLLFFYMLFVFTSAIFSVSPTYVLIYSLMLLGMIFYSLYLATAVVVKNDTKLFKYLTILLPIFVGVSLLGALLSLPSFFYFDVWGSKRVQGVYVEPAKLAQIGAIISILAWHIVRNKTIKVIVLTCSFTAMVLAGNRSYMIAYILLTGLLVLDRYNVKNLWVVLLGGGLALACLLVISVAGKLGLDEFSYLRLHSLSNLSGRTTMWSKAVPAAMKRITGAGYTLGGHVLYESEKGKKIGFNRRSSFSMFSSSAYKSTLHNGFVQSLCDLGPFGALAYMLLFLRGCFFVWRTRLVARVRIFHYIFLFYTMVNFSATILISPTEINTLLFFVSWFGLMLTYKKMCRDQALASNLRKSRSINARSFTGMYPQHR